RVAGAAGPAAGAAAGPGAGAAAAAAIGVVSALGCTRAAREQGRERKHNRAISHLDIAFLEFRAGGLHEADRGGGGRGLAGSGAFAGRDPVLADTPDTRVGVTRRPGRRRAARPRARARPPGWRGDRGGSRRRSPRRPWRRASSSVARTRRWSRRAGATR